MSLVVSQAAWTSTNLLLEWGVGITSLFPGLFEMELDCFLDELQNLFSTLAAATHPGRSGA
jgi:hypothetical protein